MLVSILIPCYNSAPFIAETLDSVLAQTYTNWECIVVDDHSTDNSVEIINGYCKKYPDKIKLYTNPRKGACAARNVAFEKSSGDYIQYLDADDLLSENKIEEQIKFFEHGDNDIILNCQWGRFCENKESVIWEKRSIDKDYDDPIDWLIDSWTSRRMNPPNSWLSPRKLIEKTGKWDEDLQINQDGDFFFRVLCNAKKIKYVNTSRAYYRNPAKKNVSMQRSRSVMISMLYSFKCYEKILVKYDNPDIRKALATNYLAFICLNYELYPDLVQEAEKYFYNLGFTKMWTPFGGAFHFVSQFLGLKNTLKLKKILKNTEIV